MKPILLQLQPPSDGVFLGACLAVLFVFSITAIALARSAKQQGGRPMPVVASLLPTFIIAAVFLFFWRTNTIRLYTYGVMLLVAFAVCWFLAAREAPRFGFKPEQITDISMIGLALGVVLARAVYVVLNFHDYQGNWKQVFSLWEGGLTFHGTVAGATIAVIVYTHLNKLSFWKTGDFMAPYMFLGYAIGRVGCFFNGCCYGYPTKLPWGTHFMLAASPEKASSTWPVEVIHRDNGEIWSKLPLHPAQLYAAILAIALYVLLRHLRARWMDLDGRHPKDDPSGHGRMVAAFFFAFGVERLITEYFRSGVTGKTVLGPITEAQVVSFLLMLGGLIIWKWRLSRPKSVPVSVEAPRRARKPRRNLQLD